MMLGSLPLAYLIVVLPWVNTYMSIGFLAAQEVSFHA